MTHRSTQWLDSGGRWRPYFAGHGIQRRKTLEEGNVMSRSADAGEDAPRIVEERSVELFDAAQSILGDRLAECRRDPDRGARITVVDLNDDDIAVLQNVAVRLRISEWTRIERADPAALSAWEQLRHDLINLRDQRPRVLQMYPTAEPGYQRPPVRLHLEPSAPAVAAAAELHDRYGDFLSLHVGALAYPPNPDSGRTPRTRTTEPHRDPVDPDEMVLKLDGSLSIRSGQTATHTLLLLNASDHPITVKTNGNLTAVITAPATGTTVGGSTGWQIQPLITFTANPGQTVHIPLLVGTASFTTDLGYTIPAGAWQLTAPMDLEDGRHLVTPPMEFTVTD